MTRYNGYTGVEVEVYDDGVVVCTLNRPDRLNAFDGQMRQDIHRLLGEVSSQLGNVLSHDPNRSLLKTTKDRPRRDGRCVVLIGAEAPPAGRASVRPSRLGTTWQPRRCRGREG